MEVKWEDFKILMNEHNEIVPKCTELTGIYHIYLEVSNHVFYETQVKKYHQTMKSNEQLEVESTFYGEGV